jgi:tRNA (adenine22-N1)-methyltransferase
MRLERVAAHVPTGARLADIGSDHAYLPVALMRRGAIAAAVAGEVAATPFHAAQRTVNDNGLAQHITVRLADGLAAIEPPSACAAWAVRPSATSSTAARLTSMAANA